MKWMVAVAFVMAAVATVDGYDWSDADFNMILRDDLEDSIDFVQSQQEDAHRVKRQAVTPESMMTMETAMMEDNSNSTCKNKNKDKICCGESNDIKIHGPALRDIRRQCFLEIKRNRTAEDADVVDVFDCKKIQENKEDLLCAMECVGKRKKLLDRQGNIVHDMVREYATNELVTKPWQKGMINGVLEKCFRGLNFTAKGNDDKTKNMTSTTTTTTTTTAMPYYECNPAMLQFSHCVWREFQLSCPREHANDSAFCQKMRERLLKKEFPNFSNMKKKNGAGEGGKRNQTMPERMGRGGFN